jgi:shikimate dehydrogenase
VSHRRAGVLGDPISHSLSPVLHRAAYRALGLDWSYDAYRVDEHGLPAFLQDLDSSWAGLSLTMPLKTTAVTLLDSVSDRVRVVCAANTVLVQGDSLCGENTDIPGMVRALDDADPGRTPITAATIIGAGATARSALAAIVERHGTDLEALVIARDVERAGGMVELGDLLGVDVRIENWEHITPGLARPLVASSVPGHATTSAVAACPTRPGLLLDVAYDPWPTPLSARWRERGGRVATGADLLLGQAVEQVALMTGQNAPVEAMRSALADALRLRVG